VAAITAIADQAREALRLADGDPGRSLAMAADIARLARDQRDRVAAAIAERAWGLAALHLHDLDTAVRHLRRSMDLGHRAGSRQLAAEARMSLAFALNGLGRPRRALHEIESAVAILDGLARARAQAQRAAILQQHRRFDEAIAGYRNVLPALRRAKDMLWVWRVLCNRGVAHTYRYEFAAAEADLIEAERLGQELGLDMSVALAQQNLGFVNATRGDAPAALQYLHRAEQSLRGLGAQLGEVLTDRSELLLSVHLAREAHELATQAVRELERERRQFTLPEVRLLLARAAILDGNATIALGEGRRAVREFTRQGRHEWAELARFSVLTARLSTPQRARVSIVEIERAAEALAAAGWVSAALEARVQAARVAFERRQLDRGQWQLEQASRGRSRGPASVRARAWYAEALLRQSAGRKRAAAIAARAGLKILDEHRATQGATDLRAHVSAHRTELAELGLRLALRERRPRRVLAWAERGRASHLLLTPVRPPDDPVVARALAELRLTGMEIEEARSTGQSSAGMVQRLVAIEEMIRDHCRQQRGNAISDPPDPRSAGDLAEELGEAVLVEFVHLDGTLHAVTVTGGHVRLHSLGGAAEIGRLVEWLRFALHRLAISHIQPSSRIAVTNLLGESAKQLDASLLHPLVNQIRDRSLVVVPTGPLQSLPWSVLPSCAGRPITVAPSASLWYAASRRPATSAGHVVVAAGPGLPGARTEAEAVAKLHAGSTTLLGTAATVEAVAASLDRARLAHLATHGKVRADNPLFSSLMLVDGPLTLYDVERLERLPRTVVLAACDSAKAIVHPGDELLGFSATFLARDTRQVVASVVPIPDAPTAPLMVAFHRLLVGGHPAAVALAQAQQQTAREGTAAMAAAAGFVCIGAGLSTSSCRNTDSDSSELSK
jgi:hypothetical protein